MGSGEGERGRGWPPWVVDGWTLVVGGWTPGNGCGRVSEGVRGPLVVGRWSVVVDG
jgi:hypothetical protein